MDIYIAIFLKVHVSKLFVFGNEQQYQLTNYIFSRKIYLNKIGNQVEIKHFIPNLS